MRPQGGARARRRRRSRSGCARPVSTTKCPASSMSVARPGNSSPARTTRTDRPMVAQRRRTLVRQPSPSRPRRRAGDAGRPGRPAAGQEQRRSPVRRLASRRRGSAGLETRAAHTLGPRPGHVDPDPHHDGGERLAGELGLGQAPRRASPRPRRPSRSLGHFNTGSTPATSAQLSAAASATRCRAQVHLGSSHPGRRRTEASRFAPGGDSQRRSSRPRPAVWWSATTTRPSATHPTRRLVPDRRVGRVDLVQPADLPRPAPHGEHHTARAIVKARLRRKDPACSRRS